MVKDEYVLVLDNPSNNYFTGQVVSGQVVANFEEPTKVKAIVIKFKGKGFCSWSEGGDKNRRYYHAKEQYFAAWKALVGKEISQQEVTEIPRGHHSYPFSFTIPTSNVPPSFESSQNHVRYTVKAHIDRPWSLVKKVKQVINIPTLLDLNAFTKQNMAGPSEFEQSKQLCCLCCESNPITGYVRTERKGYVPGETIVFNAEISNRSRRGISWSKCQLVMVVTLIAGSRRHVYRNKFDKIEHGTVGAGGSDVYSKERLNIPPVPPSYLFGCNVIDVKYYIALVVKPAGPALKLRVHCEVVIGGFPLEGVAAQYGVIIPPPLSSGSLKGVRDHTALESIPQVSFEESIFGRFDLGFKRKKGKPEYKDTNIFIPKYAYYKWTQQSLEDLFTIPLRNKTTEFQNYPRF